MITIQKRFAIITVALFFVLLGAKKVEALTPVYIVNCVNSTNSCNTTVFTVYAEFPQATSTATTVYIHGVWDIGTITNFDGTIATTSSYSSGIMADGFLDISGYPDGNYFLGNNNDTTWLFFSMLGGIIANTNTPYQTENNQTRISSFIPMGGQTIATGTSKTLGASVYLANADYHNDYFLRLKWHKNESALAQCADVICSTFEIGQYQMDFTTGDYANFITLGQNPMESTTTPILTAGIWTMTAELRRPSGFFNNLLNVFGLGENGLILSSSTTFIAGNLSSFDILQAQTKATVSTFVASSTTSLANVKDYCSLSTSFALSDCIYSLFLPNETDIQNTMDTLRTTIFAKFPFGYFTDFASIVSTTTVGSMTILDATTTSALGFGQQHIKLDISHSLDYILNATTSIYANQSASSTQTFYQITSYYWNIVVYFGVAFYIISRIIGSSIIPNKFGEKGSLSDTSSGDDSYRLKEYLYKHRK